MHDLTDLYQITSWSWSQHLIYYKDAYCNKQPLIIDKDSRSTVPTQKSRAWLGIIGNVINPYNVKRMLSAGLPADLVLQTTTGHLNEHYNLGPKLVLDYSGTTFIFLHRPVGYEFACNSPTKWNLLTAADVQRKTTIIHHLPGHSNVASIHRAYGDFVEAHLVIDFVLKMKFHLSTL
ncbi:putative non-specific serine/threonine protein kinase [Helianthus debilis subsp. tardiflorus]